MAEEEDVVMEGAQEVTDETKKSSPPPTLVNDAAFKSTSVALIEKLLQFSTPRLDSKIVNVLFLDGMMDIFMTHISRLDPTMETVELEHCTIEQKLVYSHHPRDMQDLDATKRSYHAMELLSGTTANHLWVQNAKFYDIVYHLFHVFLPNSHGNLNHFFRIFQHLVRRHPCDMLDVVILRNHAGILFHSMLPYLTQPPIMESLLHLIFVRDVNPETKEQRLACYEQLYTLGLLEWLVKVMQQLKQFPDYVEATQEFLIRLIEESSQVDYGDILFKALRTDKGGEIMEMMVKQAIQPGKSRERMITVLRLLVKNGMLTTRASPQPVQGPLYFVSLRCQDLLLPHIPEFCELFMRDRKDMNTKVQPLTLADLDLLDIIYHILYNANEKTELLASIPSAFWKILVNQFFERSTSTIYHTLFYRLVCLVLAINYEPTLVVLVRKQGLITRLIDAYHPHKDIRGYALLILNQLRLMADAHHSALIRRIIKEHPRYQAFLPVLRKDTLAQTQSIYTWKLDACPRPPAHLGPSPPIQSVHFSPYTGAIPLMTHMDDHHEDDVIATGIDLGSDFAFCLGFKETEHGIETPYEYLSRRNSDHSVSSYASHPSIHEPGFPMDILWGESLTAEVDDEPLEQSNQQQSINTHHSSKSNKRKKKRKHRGHK